MTIFRCFPAILSVAVACGLSGCKRSPPAPPSSVAVEAVSAEPGRLESKAAESPPREQLATPYPPGRWRLVRPESLQGHVLWLSHLLIRHRDAKAGVSFEMTPWAPPQPVSTRTRREAFELSNTLAEHALRDPGQFAELARESSEDPGTRDQAGSLGGVEAAQMLAWPGVLDALAAIGDGEVSRPVETEFGFHVFLRRPPPAEYTVSGESIVIGYDEAPWLHQFLARRAVPQRSRQEAHALAMDLAAEARRSPDVFASLVERYSDHQDALRGGDLGAWSTREPSYCPLIIERLQNLQIGQVADPLDTRFGFQVIRRTPLRTRRLFAMESIQAQIDLSLSDTEPGSMAVVSKQLREIGAAVKGDPLLFSQFQKRHCCEGREQWVEGRGPVRAELALAASGEGRAWEPLAIDRTMLALIKSAPIDTGAPPQRNSVGLPEPRDADLEYFFSSVEADSVLARCPERVSQRLGSSEEERARLERIHAVAAQSLRENSAPGPVLETLLNEVRGLLGPARNDAYTQVLQELVQERMLAPALVARTTHTFGAPLAP